eukprot:756536-Hanusia_phi.AAC.1
MHSLPVQRRGAGGGPFIPEHFPDFVQDAARPTSSWGSGRCGVGLKLMQKSESSNVMIEKIQKDSASDVDGRLQVGDLILKVDGISIDSLRQVGLYRLPPPFLPVLRPFPLPHLSSSSVWASSLPCLLVVGCKFPFLSSCPASPPRSLTVRPGKRSSARYGRNDSCY